MYDSVFDEHRFLLENQSEYFYREYILFYMEQGYDLTAPIRCYVERGEEIRDCYLKMLLEMDLEFASVTFNNPEYMLDNAKILFDEGLISLQDYRQKCLIINMLNCRREEAEKFADPTHEENPLLASEYERMLFVWKGHRVVPDCHWDSMQKWSLDQLNTIYVNETWQKPVKEILERCGTGERKAIVVDLWAVYWLLKTDLSGIMDCFEKVYITHDTISMALQEINKVNDNDIRIALLNFEKAGNVIIPGLKDQLELRSPDFKYMEIHQVLLLAEILNCPALVGEFRFSIPDRFKNRVIRPIHGGEMYSCMNSVLVIG